MKYFFPIISFLLFFCQISYSQTTICTFPTSKFESIKLEEFVKLDTLQLKTIALRINRYTAYLVYDKESKSTSDSTDIIAVTVNGNSLKDPEFLKALNKFTPPFKIIFEEMKVLDLENNQRTVMPLSFSIE